jgi:sec-independent protein translocase protein TatC
VKPSQTFHDHVAELRRRLLWIILAIGSSGIVGYLFRVPVIRFLQKPLGAPLYYTSPAGSFNFVIKIAYVIGIFIALPVIVYQLVRFIEPALPIRIKNKIIAKVITASFFLALLGAAFGFYIIIPTSLHFFMGYSTNVVKPLISATEYLTYVINVILTFALLFQIPLVVLFINYVRPIKPKDLLKYQKHIIVGAFILSVILPFTYDPVTQFVMAVPIVFLYYLSIVILIIANRRSRPLTMTKPVGIITNGDLLADESTPIKDLQALTPILETTSTPPIKLTPSTALSIDGLVGINHKTTLIKTHENYKVTTSTASIGLSDQEPTFSYRHIDTKSRTLEGFLSSSRKTNKVVPPENSSPEIAEAKNLLKYGYKKYSPVDIKNKKLRTLDGFLPTLPIKKLGNLNKLDDIYPFSVS